MSNLQTTLTELLAISLFFLLCIFIFSVAQISVADKLIARAEVQKKHRIHRVEMQIMVAGK